MRRSVFLPLVLLLVAATSCDHTVSFPFENATGGRVHVSISVDTTRTDFTLDPGETSEIATSKRFWTGNVVARDDSGNVVFDEQISWQELTEQGKVVITRSPD